MTFKFDIPEGKTNYQIIDEHGEKTTITLEKWVADILQIAVPDVHAAIKSTYDKICTKKPELGRKAKGNLVRDLAMREAEKHQDIKKQILGWNNEEYLAYIGDFDFNFDIKV